jgi:hypothetical protein
MFRYIQSIEQNRKLCVLEIQARTTALMFAQPASTDAKIGLEW